MATRDIRCIDDDELSRFLAELHQPSFRRTQIREWLWGKGARSFADMTNLPLSLRDALASTYTIERPSVLARQVSRDGTRKYLVGFPDGCAVETVGIPSHDESRLTVCFSTQSGCAMGCVFCATGQAGFTRNLTVPEMYDQVALVRDDFGRRVSNVVAMGQGEPFLNYDALLAALRLMNDPVCLGIGARHITVSTCGITGGIERFSHEHEQFTLAVSLHSAIQQSRDTIMPGLRSHPLDELSACLRSYVDVSGRRPTLEYTLIQGINDDRNHAEALVAFCKPLHCHVNLIQLNPNPLQQDGARLAPSKNAAMFATILNSENIEVSSRVSRGADIDGACGQLHRKHVG